MRVSQFVQGLALTIAVASSLRAAAPDYEQDLAVRMLPQVER